MRKLYVAKDLMDAHLMAGLLEANGIQAYVGNELLQGVRPEVGMDAGSSPTVFVRDEDHARAKQLLGEDLPGGACRR